MSNPNCSISSSFRSCCIVKRMSGMSIIDDLTNEVLIEIFLRLPAKTLHRFKTVSKRWLSLISSPCFARSYICTHISDPSNNVILYKVRNWLPLSGKVYTLHFPSNGDNHDVSGEVCNFDFIPSLVPPLGPNYTDCDEYHIAKIRRYRTSIGLKWLRDVYVKGTSGGLILLQGVFQNSHLNIYADVHERDDHYYYHYYVCNPVTKKWKELPLIQTSDLIGFTCYHLQQGVGDGEEGDSRIWVDVASYDNIIKRSTNFDPNKVEFTVVSIHGDEEDAVFKIKIISSRSGKPGWSTFCVPFPRGYKWIRLVNRFKVLFFFNGKFHWCGENCVVAYDPFNRPEECEIIPFPPMDCPGSYDHVLGASEGCLTMVTRLKPGFLMVWKLLDYDKQVWVKKYDVNYEKCLILMSFVGGDNDKVYMLDIEDISATITILDLRNQSLQHIYTHPSSLENGYDVESVISFLSSPWPTCVPSLQHK